MKNFRIIIPRIVEYFLNLVSLILAKHNADGVDSKLNLLDMVKMQSLFDLANDSHTLAVQLNADKEKAVELRNHALGIEPEQNSFTPNTVLYYVSSIRDHLMGVFKGTEQVLGDWGFEISQGTKGKRVAAIPLNPVFLIILAKKILKKHTDDALDSILTAFDMAAFSDLIDEAKAQDDLAKQLDKDKEKAVQIRDNALGFGSGQRRITPGTLLYFVTSVRDVLKGHYRGLEQTLGDWGFEVNTSLPPSEPDPEVTSVSGTVTDAVTLLPIEGVTVEFQLSTGNVQAVSGTTGEYSTEIEIPVTELTTITINHPGYQPFNNTQTVTPGEEHEFDFSLQLV